MKPEPERTPNAYVFPSEPPPTLTNPLGRKPLFLQFGIEQPAADCT